VNAEITKALRNNKNAQVREELIRDTIQNIYDNFRLYMEE